MQTTDDWMQYRERLRNFLRLESSGMILNADEEYEQRFSENSNGRAGFKLQNGSVVKEFLTIWELFDHSFEFKECIEKLALKASDIRRRVPYSKIVTATLTAEELCNHVFDWLKRNGEGVELSTYHFGDYPTTPLPNGKSGQFKDENILIITDITSTGSLIRNMAEIILKEGGTVVAALSVVITNRDWITEQTYARTDSRLIQASRGGIRIHHLTDYGVTPLDEGSYDPDKLIPIDYSSVLPESRTKDTEQYLPEFTLLQTFEHLEQAGGVDFSFYKFDERHNTYTFILPKLLERYKTEIWEKIRDPIMSIAQRSAEQSVYLNEVDSGDSGGRGKNLLLVTTYKQKDILFKDFVQGCLAEENINTATLITLKRNVKDIPSRNLTLGVRRKEVSGREVVLLLATLSTTQGLRNLISLLVSCEVKKITVICLLNEMGPFTTSFINAIERFTKRVKATTSNSNFEEDNFTDFEFYMLYNLLDIDSDDIAKMHKEADWLFSQFNSRTKVLSFQRISKRVKGYFQSYKFASRTYEPSKYEALPSEYTIRDNCNLTLITDPRLLSIPIHTQEGKIALMTYNLALHRDFKPIMQELKITFSRKTFFHLYGLILSDIHYLQFTKSLTKLKDQILTRLEEVWQQCFAWEDENRGAGLQRESSYLSKRISAIAYLLFGLGIIAHYESRTNIGELSIQRLLFCGKPIAEWIEHYPQYMWQYFGDERIFYFIAFLLHNLIPGFSRRGSREQIIEELNTVIGDFKRALRKRYELDDDQESEISKSKIQLIGNNLDALLTETGKHEQLEKHQTIRYLQREVLRPKEGHNPIFTNLAVLLNAFETFFTQNQVTDMGRRLHAEDKILEKLDDALNATSSLPIITESIRQLFYFTPSVREDRERYTNITNQENSFAADTEQIINQLTEIRLRKSFSRMNYETLQTIFRKLREDFYDSQLREALKGYIVCLDDLVEKTLLEVNERLNKEGFNDFLKSEFEYIRTLRGNNNHQPLLVLSDHYLLQEMLRNIFYNLRYSFPVEERAVLPDEPIKISFREERFTVQPDNQNQDGVFLTLSVKGRAPKEEDFYNPEQTIADQLFKFKEFGGQWELTRSENPSSFLLELIFVSRRGF